MPRPILAERLTNRRPYSLLVCGVAAAIGLTAFPLFHVHRLRLAEGNRDALVAGAPAFDAQSYAKSFWADKLLGSTNRATDVGSLLTALVRDPAAAALQYGHHMGLGGRYYHFI